MAVRDIEAFLRQRAVLFDPNMDVTVGSPFDTRVIQPTVRRLGTDPFTVDITTFINDRLVQAFPDLATKEGDALTDLLNKPASVLWDPIVREIRRTQRGLSLEDPATLTEDEAEALGANFFRDRRKGNLSKGVARIYVANPQNLSLSPVNFVTSKSGLHFFPTEIQSIRTEEIILNVSDDGLYYFDFNVVAEDEGVDYNIGPNQLVSIANVSAVVRVTNTRRFTAGEEAETVEEYVNRLQKEIGEKSLVTLRGIAAKILDSFPEVNRLNVIGFGDPEMERDVIKGGGLGGIVAAGTSGVTVADSEGKEYTRRFSQSTESFVTAITGDASSWVLTVFGAFDGSVIVQDMTVREVISDTDLDVEEQIMLIGATGLYWTLRKKELTLSDIPGGILFPDTDAGTVDVPDDEVHVGGAYDVHVRGTDFDESTLAIDNVSDDEPLLRGTELQVGSGGNVYILDYLEGTDYDEDDSVWQVFESAEVFTYALQILEGVDAGVYRIIRVSQTVGSSPTLTLDPQPTNPGTTLYNWRLFDEINIDLVEPKETRVDGADLRTLQGSDIVDTFSALDFNAYGVSEGDTLRILSGPDAGDYQLVAAPLAPSFNELQLDTSMTQSQSNLDFLIFRPNDAGGIDRPLVRIRTVEILDSSSQPIGSTIPYAKPIDIQSRAFQNPARGVKWDLADADVGLLSQDTTGGVFTIANGETLVFFMPGAGVPQTVTFASPGTLSLASVINQINAQLTGHPEPAIQVGATRFGIRPRARGVFLIDGTARTAIFGNAELRTTYDVRSATIDAAGGWGSLTPAVDYTSRLDVLQVTDGYNVGFYEAPYLVGYSASYMGYPYTASTALLVAHEQPEQPVHALDFEGSGFTPQENRHVQVGARSIGSARLYFLEPTTFECDSDSRFGLETEDGTLNFLPDPTLTYQRIPALPAGAQPGDGASSALGTQFVSASSDFVRSVIKPGDQLIIGTFPIEGTQVLSNPVSALVNKTLIFSIDDGPDRTLTFIRDDLSLAADEVSRSSVAAQINAAAGETIAEISGSDTLLISTARKVTIRGSGTANALILQDLAGTSPTETFVGSDQDNLSPHAGTYTLIAVGTTTVDTLDIDGSFPANAPYSSDPTNQNFEIHKQGVQRITATSMADNEAEAGLYYFDVELLSEGTGDAWNIDAEQQMTATGYRSDGFYLTTADPDLAFSSVEEPTLVLSRSILEEGVDDDPVNATDLTGQNIQITYDRAALVGDVQSFVSSEVERVVCANPLGRHLIPHFVRFDLNYIGGSKTSIVVPEMEQYIQNLYPVDELESSDLQKIVMDRGATSVENPIDLIAVVHYPDRTIYAARSQDSLTTGRLAAFIPDVLNVTRNTA